MSQNKDFKRENRLRLFGHEDAEKEDDNRLESYFYKTQQYEDTISNIPFLIITGEKGTGKSAILKMAYFEEKEAGFVPIWIRQDDLVELYEGTTEDKPVSILKVLWKKAVARLVAMKLAATCNVVVGDEFEIATKWAYEHGYATKDFISNVVEKLKPGWEKYINNEKMNQDSIGEHHILEKLFKGNKVILFLDDFDLDWKGNQKDVALMKSLILALRDMTSDITRLYVRIAIRTDVYEMIRTQEFSDKIASSVIECKWNNQEIMKTLAKRICTYYGMDFCVDENEKMQYQLVKYLDKVFVHSFSESTKVWKNAPTHRVIYSLIRRKPRDMVKLCHGVAEIADKYQKDIIDEKCILDYLDSYSRERLQDLVNEYNNQISNLRDLLIRMAPTSNEVKMKKKERYVYLTDKLLEKIKNIQSNINIKIYSPDSYKKVKATPYEIAHFLYRIGFITGRKENGATGKIQRKFYDEMPDLLEKHVGDRGYAWEIHPAYRAAIADGSDDVWKNTIDFADLDENS